MPACCTCQVELPVGSRYCGTCGSLQAPATLYPDKVDSAPASAHSTPGALATLSVSSSRRKQKKQRRLITPPIVPLVRHMTSDYAPVVAGSPQMSGVPIVFSLPALLFPSTLGGEALLNFVVQCFFVALVGSVVISGQYSSPGIKDIFPKNISSTVPQSTTTSSSPSTMQAGSFTIVLNGRQAVISGIISRSSQETGIVVQGTSIVQRTLNTALPLDGTVNNTLGTVNNTVSIVNGTVQTTLDTVNHTTKTIIIVVPTTLKTVKTVTTVVPTTLKTVSSTVKTVTSTIPTTLKTVKSTAKTVTSTVPTTLKTVKSTAKTITSTVPTTLKTGKKTAKYTKSVVSGPTPKVVKTTSKVGKTTSGKTHSTTKTVKDTTQKSIKTISQTTRSTTAKSGVKTGRSTPTGPISTKISSKTGLKL